MFSTGVVLRTALRLLACVSLLGCSVTALAERESAIALNECEADSECPRGRCRDGACVATTSELSTLLFELTPTAVGGDLTGASFLQYRSDLSIESGAIELTLDAVPIVGSVIAEGRRSCSPVFVDPNLTRLPLAANGAVPCRITFSPSLRVLGVPVAGRVGDVNTNGASETVRPASYDFRLGLPAGAYDVYVEPYPLAADAASSPGCKYPPQLIRGLSVSGSASVRLPLAQSSRLKLTVVDREQGLTGWTADIVDAATSKVISTRVPLTLPSNSGGFSEYSVELEYLPVVEHELVVQQPASKSELVRLSPPPGVVAPVVLFERVALELFSPGVGRIDQLPGLSLPVRVEGHVFSGPSQRPADATLTFVGRSLLGVPAGTLVSFTRTLSTEGDGYFEVDLLPGTYDVHAAPLGAAESDPPRSTTHLTWEVAASPSRQAGRALSLADAVTLSGAAVVPNAGHEGARGASVVAEASATAFTTDVLGHAYEGLPIAPRATGSVITDNAGNFAVSADAGLFDFSVRPPEGSGFAWLVMPRLSVGPGPEGRELATLTLPLPVPLSLRANLDGDSARAELVGARVRAFAPLDAEGFPTSSLLAHSLVPVAEGRLDQAGSVRLLVPAELHRPLSD